MFKSITLCAAAAGLLAASPATAQVVGKWRFKLDDGTRVEMETTRDRDHPERMIGIGEIDGSQIVFVGDFRNLKWYGTWYWYGRGATRLPNLRSCATPVYPRPGTPGYGQRTTHTGGFEIVLNADENQMKGTWKSACSGPDGRAESSMPIEFKAKRLNTYSLAAPAAVDYRPTAPAPAGSGDRAIEPKPRLAGEAPVNDGPCTDQLGLRYSATPSTSAPAMVFSSRYRLRPCMTTAGRWVQVDFLNPEGKRPTRLVLQGLRVSNAMPIDRRQTLFASPTGRTLQHRLPFIGEPRAGEVISRIGMSGGICSAPLWLAWLDFSDGTRSREPIGMIISMCGMEAHPEMLPPRPPASG